MIVLQTLASLQMVLVILDAKNAFCRGRELKRRRGPLFSNPCDGLGLEPDAPVDRGNHCRVRPGNHGPEGP